MDEKISLKEKIKLAEDIKKEVLNIPEWGVEVEVRTLSGMGRARVLSVSMKSDSVLDFEKMYSELLLNCVFEPDTDNLVFERSDLPWLMAKSSGPIEKIANKAMELSGLTPASAAIIEKNSGNIQNVDSISD